MREEKERVYFVKDKQHGGEVTAVFPYQLGTDDPTTMGCYATIGQHGTCSEQWVLGKNNRRATPKEYKALYDELTNMVGYDLKILNVFPRTDSLNYRIKGLKTIYDRRVFGVI